MRVLVVSDKVEPMLYSPGVLTRAGDVDMVFSCGDMPFYYLEFIISMLNRPTYYVFGNHGREVEYQSGKGEIWQRKTEPQGAVNFHCRTAREGALLLAGLEGSMRYNNAPRFQYTNGRCGATSCGWSLAVGEQGSLWTVFGCAGRPFAALRHP